MGKSNSQILQEMGISPIDDQQESQQEGGQQSAMPQGAQIAQGPSFMQKFKNMAEATRIPQAGAGMVQGGYDEIKSIADILPGMAMSDKKMPDINMRQHIPDDLLSQAAYGAGYVGTQAAGDAGIMKLLGKVPSLAGTGWKELAAKGVITEGATKENAPGGRLAASTVGAVASPLLALRTGPIAENIGNMQQFLKKKYNNLYDYFFDSAEKAGVGQMKAPPIDFNKLKNLPTSAKGLKSVQKYVADPTLENAHWAQSDLMKLSRKVKPQDFSEVKAARDYADDLVKRIRGAGVTQLMKTGNEEMIPQYAKISEGYKNEVVPYLHDDIDNYLSKKMSSSELVKKLSMDFDFMNLNGANHPDLLQYQKLKGYGEAAKKYAVPAALGAIAVKKYGASGGAQSALEGMQ